MPTGSATGRSRSATRTTIAKMTQLFPYPTFLPPFADPSWNQLAACTLGPRRWNSVSSIATLTASSAATRRRTTSRARTADTSSIDQRAWEKNRCARWWLQVPDSPAPTSIPHTVRRADWETSPQARAQNTGKVQALKHPRSSASRPANDGGADGPLGAWRAGFGITSPLCRLPESSTKGLLA